MIATQPSAEQPLQRVGEVLAREGRWNAAGLGRLAGLHEDALTWTSGPLGHVAAIGRTVVGNIHRNRPEHPWLVRIEGFEWWNAPTAIMNRWHYSPVRAEVGVRAAKEALSVVFRTRPDAGL